jgi:DnaJ-class molecular chaperone
VTLQEVLKDPEVKKMYRDLVKKYHPDKKNGDKNKR